MKILKDEIKVETIENIESLDKNEYSADIQTMVIFLQYRLNGYSNIQSEFLSGVVY